MSRAHPSFVCVLWVLRAEEARNGTMESENSFQLVSMNHQAWKPMSCLFGLAEHREKAVRRWGLLANGLQYGAMTSHSSQPKWAGHPLCLLLFWKLYIYPAWGWAVQKSHSHCDALKSFLSNLGKIYNGHSLVSSSSSPSFLYVRGRDPLGF